MKNRNIIIFLIPIFVFQMWREVLFAFAVGQSDKKKAKVVLIGIDAADLHFLESLVKKGKLPNFNRLLQDSSFGRLPTVLGGAPLQWTTLATGRSSKEHGITGYYFFPQGLNSKMRKCKAIWNILSEQNIKVGIVGWWATWPAEKVNGYMVSSYTKYRAEPPDDIEKTRKEKLQLTYTGTVYVDKKNKLRQTYPEEFYFEIKSKIQAKERIKNKEVFLQFSGLGEYRQKFFDLKWSYIANEIFTNIGMMLLKKPELNFISFFMQGIDVAFHRNNRETPYLLEDYYIYTDKKLGDCLDYIDKNTTIIIVSEHGHIWGIDHLRKEIDGIIIVKGPKVKKNYVINSASVLDIVPTILYLFGLDIPKNMEGKVLTDIFEDEHIRKFPPKLIDVCEDWDKNKHDFPAFLPSNPFDDVIYERLVKIGYFR